MKIFNKSTNSLPVLIIVFVLLISVSCKENTQTTTTTNTTTRSNSEMSYTSKMTKPDKKKYFSGSSVVYEIKYKPDGFKLRTPSSKLLWKVKLYDTKIKISDNEENLNPYEIKFLDTENAKLEKDGKVIARTTYDAATKSQNIKYLESGETRTVNQAYSPLVLVEAIRYEETFTIRKRA